MIANLVSLADVYTNKICLEDRNVASYNLIEDKIINRVEFVYIFKLQDCNLFI